MRFTIYALLLILGLLIHASSGQSLQTVSGDLRVYFLDVGKADAIYIVCPTGEHSMLIDAADSSLPESAEKFRSELQKLTGGLNQKIDVVVASHGDKDHIGNMKWVLDNYRVERYLDNGSNTGTGLYRELQIRIADLKQINPGFRYHSLATVEPIFADFCPAENVSVEILNRAPISEFSDENNRSIILRLDYNTTSFLFPGDADKELETSLLIGHAKLTANVLKAAHHGGNSASSKLFLEVIRPDYIVVTSGKPNFDVSQKHLLPQRKAIDRMNEIVPGSQFRKDLIPAYDKKTNQWQQIPVKQNILFPYLDGTIEIRSDGTRLTLHDSK